MNSGIYKIINKLNNNIYIGSAVNIFKRWGAHKNDLKNNKHANSKFQRSYNKHGLEIFEFNILLYCDKKDLLFYEQRAINVYKPEYNICKIASSCLNVKRSNKTKAKISRSLIGNSCHLGHKHSEETKIKLSIIGKGNKNALGSKKIKRLKIPTVPKIIKKPHSEETKTKLSIINLGKKLTEQTKEKISTATKGKKKEPLSKETKAKISASKKGKPWSEARKLAQLNKQR